MPVTEFDEILRNDEKADGKIGAAGMTSGESQRLGAAGNAFRLNYWGYGPSYLYAVKAAYGSGNGISPEAELKTLVKKLHQEGWSALSSCISPGKRLRIRFWRSFGTGFWSTMWTAFICPVFRRFFWRGNRRSFRRSSCSRITGTSCFPAVRRSDIWRLKPGRLPSGKASGGVWPVFPGEYAAGFKGR